MTQTLTPSLAPPTPPAVLAAPSRFIAPTPAPAPAPAHRPHRIGDKPEPLDPWAAAYEKAATARALGRAIEAPCGEEGDRDEALSDPDHFLRTYRKLGSLRAACDACDVKPFYGYLWLRKSGNLSADDRAQYGSAAARLGAAAEKEFQRLVPEALPANNVIRRNNPAFDFTVHGLTVDVKYSAIGTQDRWGFHFAKRKRMKPDFYALFFATAPSGDLADGYRLFLVPHEMFAGRSTMTMRPGHPTHPLNRYEIEPDGLAVALAGMLQ